jgi:uncharacterized protein YqeY
MGLKERIDGDLKAAMKAREELRLSTVRMLKAAMKNREIEKGSVLADEDVFGVIASMIKQRKDSVEQYARGGRADLAEKEEAEIGILQEYLPEQLSEEEVEEIIKEAISEAGASSSRDMGKVMKLVMPRVRGRADGKLVNEKVRELLGG